MSLSALCLLLSVLSLWPVVALNTTVESPSISGSCRLVTVKKGISQRVTETLKGPTNLIEYRFEMRNYTTNPLLTGATYTYKGNVWTHVGSSQGLTILNLAFNYGVLSLMTLTFGVAIMEVELDDKPIGCVGQLSESGKVDAVLQLVLRMLDAEGEMKVFEEQSTVCYQVMRHTGTNMINFTDRCCSATHPNDDIDCFTGIPNQWLDILEILLAVLHFVIFVFGPVLLPGWMYTAVLDIVDYVVVLKEPIYKTICISRLDTTQADVQANHVLDLRSKRDFQRCRRKLRELPSGMILPIKISRYDLRINYKKLLTEHNVPVSINECVAKGFFQCKMRELEPFRDCCNANLYGCYTGVKPRPWISLCHAVGRVLLVFLLPTPYYIRLLLYYKFEHPEIQLRLDAASRIGLPIDFHYSIIQYLTPTHFVYIMAYVICITAGLTVAYTSGSHKTTRLQKIVIKAFEDMKKQSMLKALGMVISNSIWPFKRFGIFGIFIGLVYWPVVMPVSILICVIYSMPLIFLLCRIVRHTFGKSQEKGVSKGIQTFDTDVVFGAIRSKRGINKENWHCSLRPRRVAINLAISLSTIVTLFSVMLLMSEVVSYIAEVLCFTLMGLIVNASKVLKYGSLMFLVVIYSYDCYSNVVKKYMKLNKDLFSEIKFRLGKAIDEFTSLPSHLQGNRGFKSCEASEQADYENDDDMAQTEAYQWAINDLILFVDSDDIPRIPKQLFEDVCQIRVSGSPGPIYRSLLQATGKFLMIVCFLMFIFIVVLSFGDNYKMSSTNQMLATMAGGFMPFMLIKLLRPNASEVNIKSVSFHSKLEEIITNFCQTWPLNDLLFDIEKAPVEGDEEVEGDNKEKDVKNGDGGEKHDKSNGKHDVKKKESHAQNNNLSVIKKDSTARHSIKKPNPMMIRNKSNKDGSNSDLFAAIDKMDLEPAEGGRVDILVYLAEDDYEWQLEWSSDEGEV